MTTRPRPSVTPGRCSSGRSTAARTASWGRARQHGAVVAVATVAGLQLLPPDDVPSPVIAGLPELDEEPGVSAACAQHAADTADVLVLVAEHAARRAGGLPGAALATEHRDVWEFAEALAEGDPELQAPVADLA
jgi:hypothetical protein